MAPAGLAEVIEPDGQADFARLKLLAPQLADEPRGLAQGKRERGLVVRLVVGQGGVAGNGGAVLDLEQQRFVPAAVGEEPQLLAPDAEFLPEQRRGQFRGVAKGARAQGAEAPLPVLADARKLAQIASGQEFLFSAGRNFEEAG